MRNITLPDLFSAVRMVEKAGVKEELLPIIRKLSEKGIEDITDIGIIGILNIASSLSKETVERSIYEWLSGIWEMDAEKIIAMPLNEVSTNFDEMAEKNDMAVFFKSLSGLIRKRS